MLCQLMHAVMWLSRRDAVLSSLARELCFGDTAINVVGRTENMCVRLHVDSKDGERRYCHTA